MSITDKQLLDLLKRAIFDNIYCVYCEYEPLEPDYDKCPECKKANPLKEAGMI